jgi:hypothetical protein
LKDFGQFHFSHGLQLPHSFFCPLFHGRFSITRL